MLFTQYGTGMFYTHVHVGEDECQGMGQMYVHGSLRVQNMEEDMETEQYL